MTTTEETNLNAFRAISDFVKQLATVFGGDSGGLRLYNCLIRKTTITHETAISKHINLFTEFCIANRDGIQSRDYKKFDEPIISYSDRVYIDLEKLFNMADADTTQVMWKHILTISALLDKGGKAREILGDMKSEESKLLTGVLDHVEHNIKGTPEETINSILKSDVMSDLLKGMSSGNLDMGSLFQTLTSVIGQIGNGGGIPGLTPPARVQTTTTITEEISID